MQSHDLITLGYGGRLAVRAKVELPAGQVLDFVAVHLHHVAHDKEARQEQATKLCGWLNDRFRVPQQVIAGDFNEIPSGLAIQVMKRRYRSAYADFFGREPLATFPTALVERPDGWAGCLDYIFISPAVSKVIAASLFCNESAADDDTLYPSDHVGIIATIES